MELKVKDFALQQGVSDSIVYRHIRQHKDALENIIIKRGNATWLTDEAQEFIRNLMVQQPIVVGDAEAHQKMEALIEENRNLLKALNMAKDRIIELQDTQLQLEAAQKEKLLLEGFIQDAKNEIATLTEEKAQELAEARQRAEEAELRVKEAEEALKTLEDEREALKTEKEAVLQENEALKDRKWYQLIFKKKS